MDTLVEFVPAITDTTYRGEWTARNELTITFVTPVLGRPYYEHIQRHRYSVGTGEVLYCTALHCVWCDCGCVAHCAVVAHKTQIRMRVPSILRCRDRSSPTIFNDTYATTVSRDDVLCH